MPQSFTDTGLAETAQLCADIPARPLIAALVDRLVGAASQAERGRRRAAAARSTLPKRMFRGSRHRRSRPGTGIAA